MVYANTILYFDKLTQVNNNNYRNRRKIASNKKAL